MAALWNSDYDEVGHLCPGHAGESAASCCCGQLSLLPSSSSSFDSCSSSTTTTSSSSSSSSSTHFCGSTPCTGTSHSSSSSCSYSWLPTLLLSPSSAHPFASHAPNFPTRKPPTRRFGEPRGTGRLQLLLWMLALLLATLTGPALGNANWRLLCETATTEAWQICNVGFFADLTCSTVPSLDIDGLLYSSAGSATSPGIAADSFFTKFTSSCTACEAESVYVGLRFDDGVGIRCASFSQCAEVTTTTTITTTVITTTAGPATSTPTSTTEPGATSTSTTKTRTTTVQPGTTTNPFQSLTLIPGFRRVASAGSCTSLALQRSAIGYLWTTVARWENVGSGATLSLDSATERIDETNPSLTTWSPSNDACSDCGVSGLDLRDSLQATFDMEIYPGSGSVKIVRSGLSTITLTPLSSPWLTFDGSSLTITPTTDLGTSGTCSQVVFEECAILNVDGYCHAGATYNFCIADVIAPVLQSSDPETGGVAPSLFLKAKLAFDEQVRIAASSTATLTVLDTDDEDWPSVTTIDLTGSLVTITTYYSATGAQEVEILTSDSMPAESIFLLEIPSGAIVDRNGNGWSGISIQFTSPCATTGCVTRTTTTTLGSASSETATEDPPVALYVGISAGVLCCGACILSCWRLYVKTLFSEEKWDEAAKYGTTTRVAPVRESVAQRAQYGGEPPNASDGPRVAAWASKTDSFAQAKAAGGFRKQKSREAEDLPSRPGNAENAGPAPTGRGKGNFTEESFSAGGWVKQVDQASGRPYWMHYKTRETRWDPPPKSTNATFSTPPNRQQHQQAPRPQTSSAPPPGQQQSSSSSPPPKKEKNTEPPGVVNEDDGASPEVKRIKAEISDQFKKTMHEDVASRKKTFKFLCLKWHPDKNQDGDSETATQIFQFLQGQKDWYLKEGN